MNPNEANEGQLLAAQLAFNAQNYLQKATRGTPDGHKLNSEASRVDWRNFIQPNAVQRHPQRGGMPMPPPPVGFEFNPQQFQQPGGFPPQPFSPQGNSDPYNLAANVSFIPMPRNEKGEEIIPPGINGPIPGSNIPTGFSMEAAQNFQMPSYGGAQTVGNTAALEEKLDKVFDELKLLKRAVNALTNLVRKTIIAKEETAHKADPIHESHS